MKHARSTAVLLPLLALMALPVLAQGVYRIVGPDGRVTFSDQPPPTEAQRPPGRCKRCRQQHRWWWTTAL